MVEVGWWFGCGRRCIQYYLKNLFVTSSISSGLGDFIESGHHWQFGRLHFRQCFQTFLDFAHRGVVQFLTKQWLKWICRSAMYRHSAMRHSYIWSSRKVLTFKSSHLRECNNKTRCFWVIRRLAIWICNGGFTVFGLVKAIEKREK